MLDRELIEAAFDDRSLLPEAADAVHGAVAALDRGEVRVAEPTPDGWVVNEWAKKAVLLYFSVSPLREMRAGEFVYYDKVPTKTDLAAQGVRVVPPGTVRYGAYCERGVVVMPGYVNIGAWVGSGTMVDTWATVGSCAQVGRNVHISGGVGIGGVLEPPSARPVVIEDGAFIGSRSIVVEGAHIGSEAVLGANTTITASTPIYDVTGPERVEFRGEVPARAIVVPGTREKRFPGGVAHLQCAYVIGYRTEATDRKIALNEELRDFDISL